MRAVAGNGCLSETAVCLSLDCCPRQAIVAHPCLTLAGSKNVERGVGVQGFCRRLGASESSGPDRRAAGQPAAGQLEPNQREIAACR